MPETGGRRIDSYVLVLYEYSYGPVPNRPIHGLMLFIIS